ncbi:flippase-like domain-containing protein [Candidatus Saccharibacteria bacterium]|nr:flippase-like domain-containing protein [Candidatus Saccharibacteria bacterium]
MSKRKFKLSARSILTILTLILVAFVIWKNFDDIKEAVRHLGETNIFVLLLLIPEQLFMYYCCGQMFFSYMSAKKGAKKVPAWELMRVSLELNFVNHAVPAGGFGGLGYITWRLSKFGATPGQTSFMYALRYIITICANQLQTIVAILFLLLFGTVPDSGKWVILATIIISAAIIGGIAIILVVASNIKWIHSFSKRITQFCNFVVRKITFGKKRVIIKYETIDKYLTDIHTDLMMARRHKRMLIKPILWGIVYSFLEIATYWVVAISLGHPWLLPQIMIGEAIGSVLGAIIPYGLYELGMAGIMSQLGVELALAGTIVVMTRVIVLGSTILSGYGFYQNAISKIGKDKTKAAKK